MDPNSSQDILSNLPDCLLEDIFSRMTIREVGRTSVLSTSWRYKWTSSPYLVFNDECIPAGLDGSAGHDKLVKIVNQVLLTHTRPILSFRISSSRLQTCSEIDNWVFALSLLSLTEFELRLDRRSLLDRLDRRNLPRRHAILPSLFSFKHLISLTLVGCIIPVPPLSFKGFGSLRTLSLELVSLSNAALKSLVSSCHELESLKLSGLESLDGNPLHIQVSSPMLNYLYINGECDDICLNKDSKLLVKAIIVGTCASAKMQKNKFNDIFGSMLGVQKLWLDTDFLKSFALSDVPTRLSYTFHHLKTITFQINTWSNSDTDPFSVALCLLNGSPNLQNLDLWFLKLLETHRLLQHTKDRLENMTFNTLRVVKFSGLIGLQIQLLLIEILLANSPVLETMEIQAPIFRISDPLIFRKELLEFRRASPQAKILYNCA